MQWTPDRNAGFSNADPGKLYLPLIQSLVHHYGVVNVEAQLAQYTSLLHWVRGILDVRRAHPVFGDGDFVPVPCDNDAVLAFLRSNATETVLCVMNMANTPRAGTVRVPDLAGAELQDVFGGGRFPAIGPDGSAVFTLGARDFFWLSVRPAVTRTPPPARTTSPERSAAAAPAAAVPAAASPAGTAAGPAPTPPAPAPAPRAGGRQRTE
jgi:maltose alpha-D-glucosyltransferase/alpha-amylase